VGNNEGIKAIFSGHLGFGGIFVVVTGIVLFSVGGTLWQESEDREKRAVEQAVRQEEASARLAELTPLLDQLKARGCTHEVEAPHAVVGPDKSTLKMSTGGRCLEVVVAAAGTVAASIVGPSGKATKFDGQGTVVFEHCPAETGEHVFDLGAGAEAVFAYAMVDCPPAFEKHKDDPEKNGLTKAQARLAVLEKEGCKRVIMAPQSVTGDRSLTAKMEPGPFCTVLVAAAGSSDNPLSAKMRSPMGEAVATPPASSEIELAYCATIAGDHAISVAPKVLDYYTLAAMDCPRKVALKHGAK
jgi:hypothetical protein